MLIVNADDLGWNTTATARILRTHAKGRITSASAMVFMESCEQSADAILASGIDLGLHLNFTSPFGSGRASDRLRDHQARTARFLRSRVGALVFNPMLRRSFEYVTRVQIDEFERLFGRVPTHIDGHHHAHLCMNMLVGAYLPPASVVRRTFTFFAGERSGLNRLYRSMIDWRVCRMHRCVDMFFSLTHYNDAARLRKLAALTAQHDVELMVHPERPDDFRLLMGDVFGSFIAGVEHGTFTRIGARGAAPAVVFGCP